MKAGEKLLVLLVEDDPAVVEVTRMLFEEHGHEVVAASSSVVAIKIISDNSDRFIVALVDINLSRFVAVDGPVDNREEKSGLLGLQFIRDSDSHHVVPFVYSGYSDAETLLRAYEIGVAGHITKGLDPRLLIAMVDNRYSLKAAMYSKIDSMTGLLNFRVFTEAVMKDLSSARESDPRAYSLILFDVDNFKDINDTHGHLTGDRTIEAVGRSIRSAIRLSDRCCRRSGDEFFVWLRGTNFDHTLRDALRIKRMVGLTPIASSEGKIFQANVSFGWSSVLRENIQSPTTTLNQLMEEADRELQKYKANMKVGR